MVLSITTRLVVNPMPLFLVPLIPNVPTARCYGGKNSDNIFKSKVKLISTLQVPVVAVPGALC